MSTPRSNRLRRLLAQASIGLAAAAAITAATATAASAHIHLNGDDVVQGGYGVLSLRVPTESDSAATSAITVSLPSDTPITSVATEPIAGWKATVTTVNLAKPVQTDDGQVSTYVSKVTWTATTADAAIQPGQFREFRISAGPLPKKATLSLPTTQTYSDGSSVNWNQIATGSAEPERPAPALSIPREDTTTSASAAGTQAPTPASTNSDSIALAVSITGVAIGGIALVLGLIALLRSRARDAVQR